MSSGFAPCGCAAYGQPPPDGLCKAPNCIHVPGADLRRLAAQVLHDDPRMSAVIGKQPPAVPSKAEAALAEIRAITGATQHRPYTALSQIDQIARRGLA